MLVSRYSGNPLALKLVADTIDERYAGDLGGFLTNNCLIFGDIRMVLEQHFSRLTGLERQILFGLAIKQESLGARVVRESLLPALNQRDFLEALQRLKRRSLVEKNGSVFVLPNIVAEYLKETLNEIAVEESEKGMFNVNIPVGITQLTGRDSMLFQQLH
ncbi:MAG: hypothetical protein AAF702_17840 [Chloroflexota bacterium]